MLLTLLGITGLVLVLLLITVGLWWRGLQEQRQLARSLLPTRSPAAPPQPLPVAVVLARPAPIPSEPRVPARPAAPESRRVTAPIAGRLIFLVSPGTPVETGQVVARLETIQRRPGPARSRQQASGARVNKGPGRSTAARARAVQALRRRLQRAEQAARAAFTALAAARQVEARTTDLRTSADWKAADAEASLVRARSELAECEAALRTSEQLYRAGAASRAELNADAEARVTAVRNLAQAQARARNAHSGSGVVSALPSAADLSVAVRQVALTRAEVASARDALQAAEMASSLPTALPPTAPARPTVAQTLGWKEVAHMVVVRAPFRGVVTRLSARTGKQVVGGATLLWVQERPRRGIRSTAPASQLAGGPVSRAALGRMMSVPGTAIQATPEGPAVWVARRAKRSGKELWIAHRQLVQLSERRNGAALIGKGLERDSRVIVAGAEQLREGQAVAVTPWRLP
jgi:biotin carboxyl carrier protein